MCRNTVVIIGKNEAKKLPQKHNRRYPELMTSVDKIQI